MTSRNGFAVTPRVIFGLVVIFVGVAFLLDNMGLVNAEHLWRFWPFAIILWGLSKIMEGSRSNRIFGAILCFLGALWAADNFVYVRFDFWRWWPLAIVIFGLLIVFRAFGNSSSSGSGQGATIPPGSSGAFVPPQTGPVAGSTVGGASNRPGSMSQKLSEVAIWSGVERRVSAPNFKRADLTAIMGGIEFDLRQAGTDQGEAVIELFVLWGGIEITVPPDWAVSNEVTAIMGGAEDQSTGTQQSKHRLVVKGVVLMGGVDIKT